MLGLTVTGQVEGEFVFLDAGQGVQLVLRRMTAPNPGATEFSFQVGDVRSKYEELKRRGVAFARPPRAVTGDQTRDLFATDFRDPDGHILSITGWVPKGQST